jgi:hypothetical protein
LQRRMCLLPSLSEEDVWQMLLDEKEMLLLYADEKMGIL